jgi:hypothetical protein
MKAKNVQQTPVAPPKNKFDAKHWASKSGISEEEVNVVKLSFDLFDSDQGGSIDINGTIFFI